MGMAKFFEGNMAKDFGVEWKKFGSGVTNWVWVRNNFFRVQVANLFWTKKPPKNWGTGCISDFCHSPPKYFVTPPAQYFGHATTKIFCPTTTINIVIHLSHPTTKIMFPCPTAPGPSTATECPWFSFNIYY